MWMKFDVAGSSQAGWVSTGSPARTIMTNGNTENVVIAQEKVSFT